MKIDKKTIIKIVLEIAVVAAVFLGLFLGYKTKKIDINSLFVPGTSTKGTDISGDDEKVDIFDLQMSGASFVYFRASIGSDSKDDSFKSYWKSAEENFFTKGAYHSFRFEDDGKEQAKNYIKTVGDLADGDLYPAVDISYYDDYTPATVEKESFTKELKAFLDAIEKKYDVKPVIRGKASVFKKFLNSGFEDYLIWVCNTDYPAYVDLGVNWFMWQYTDSKSVIGLEGEEKKLTMDLINWRGAMQDIRILIIPEPTPEQEQQEAAEEATEQEQQEAAEETTEQETEESTEETTEQEGEESEE